MQEINEVLEKALPGIFGSAGALFWLGGGPKRKAGLLVFGVIFTYYVGPALAEWVRVNEAATGLVLGLFSMAIVDKIFDALKRLDVVKHIDTFFNKIISKFFG